jgi:hypothetical protein
MNSAATSRYRVIAREYTADVDSPRFLAIASPADEEFGRARVFDQERGTLGEAQAVDAILKYGMWVLADDTEHVDVPVSARPAVRSPRREPSKLFDQPLRRHTIGGQPWSRSENPLPVGNVTFVELFQSLRSATRHRPLRILVMLNPTWRVDSQLRALHDCVADNDHLMLLAPPNCPASWQATARDALNGMPARFLDTDRDVQRLAVSERGSYEAVFLSGYEDISAAKSDVLLDIRLPFPEDRFANRCQCLVVDGAGPNAPDMIDSLRESSQYVGLTYPLATGFWGIANANADASQLADCIAHTLDNLASALERDSALDESLITEFANFIAAIGMSGLSRDQEVSLFRSVRAKVYKQKRFKDILCNDSINAALARVVEQARQRST